MTVRILSSACWRHFLSQIINLKTSDHFWLITWACAVCDTVPLIARVHLRLLVYHIKGKILYKGQLSRSNRFALFNKLAVARGKPTIIVSKTQQLGSIHSKQFLYKQNLKQFNFIHLFCEACERRETKRLVSSIDDRRKQVSKWALITSWIQNCPFHCQNVTYQYNLRCCYADKVSCNINKATRSKTKKVTFSFAAMNFVQHQSSPLKRCESIQF